MAVSFVLEARSGETELREIYLSLFNAEKRGQGHLNWRLSHRFDRQALPIADSHYNRQKVGSPQFVPPGRCVVLLTRNADALWVTSWPFAEYVKHAWAGAWVNSLFCNRGQSLSSDLIREAIAVTRSFFDAPPLGMVTFVDKREIRSINPGCCYKFAGFRKAICPDHMVKNDECAACNGRTKGGLIALQMLPVEMPEPAPPYSSQMSLIDLVA